MVICCNEANWSLPQQKQCNFINLNIHVNELKIKKKIMTLNKQNKSILSLVNLNKKMSD